MFILLAIKVSDSTENIVLNVGEILYIDSAVKNIKELHAVKQQSGQDVTLKHFDIELKNADFAYKDGQKIIDGVSFVAKQNEITALVGPSGCGKTTLLRLLSRLYDYQEGQITIDGKNI
ncbi:ABC transporter ATP-binding protein [Streptococcus vicugnae]|uniref:ABC transporter ATP-binding protein n=1 Tax=Streptococcus vicugnae TaxID=2740579 RepID=A0A4R5G4E7_9STRE|nr:ATP-binding cassette domain-containing protein [Streptococcus vicugnae]TDE71098.1 ABC transporter ATP-binding protein [Streptococcus vicugnae]